VPSWLIDLLAKSPVLAVVVYYVYKVISKALDSPMSIATIFGVMGTKNQRRDAQQVLKVLCHHNEEEASTEDPAPAKRRPRHRRRRKRPPS
jgi:hypothetical protein